MITITTTAKQAGVAITLYTYIPEVLSLNLVPGHCLL
jgi:hypothetical protein